MIQADEDGGTGGAGGAGGKSRQIHLRLSRRCPVSPPTGMLTVVSAAARLLAHRFRGGRGSAARTRTSITWNALCILLISFVRRGVALATNSLLVIAQADDREQVSVAQLAGPLLEALAAPLRITQLLPQSQLGVLGLFLLLLQLRDLLQHALPQVSPSGGRLLLCGGRLAGAAGAPFQGVGDLRGEGSGRPAGQCSRRPIGTLWSGGGAIAFVALSVSKVW